MHTNNKIIDIDLKYGYDYFEYVIEDDYNFELKVSKDFEVIEMYSNPKDYKKGIDDEKYYCEIWIPIKKKQ